MPSREFPNWYVVTQSTGERYDRTTYSDARSYADSMFMNISRAEHYQVFCDNGKGPPEMMYDAFVGDETPAVASHDGECR